MTSLAALEPIRAFHYGLPTTQKNVDRCSHDKEIWPCHAQQLIDMLDGIEAVRVQWWTCVWCDQHFPHEAGSQALRDHSATCHSHPAVKEKERLEEHVRRLIAELEATRAA